MNHTFAPLCPTLLRAMGTGLIAITTPIFIYFKATLWCVVRIFHGGRTRRDERLGKGKSGEAERTERCGLLR